MAQLMAIKPGMVCETAIILKISCSFNNLCFFTKISSITGIITNPPPITNKEILKKEAKIKNSINNPFVAK